MNAVRFFALSALLLSGSVALAQPDVKAPDRAPALDSTPKSDKSTKRAFLDGERRIAFEMSKKPWSGVIEWLVDQTDLTYISLNQPPTGTFNFISPKGATYSFPEVIDIINEGLLHQKFILIRRKNSFSLLPADERVDPSLVQNIALADLDKYGSTEIVSVALPLKVLNADEFAPAVKKLMGPFGEVTPLTPANQLRLQDTAGNLRLVKKYVDGIEKSEDGEAETYSHKCQYVKAASAERVLREFLGDPVRLLTIQSGGDGRDGNKGGDNNRGGGGGPFGGGSGGQAKPQGRVNMHYITSDEKTNTVYVNGRPDKIAQAKSVMTKLDVPQYEGQPKYTFVPPILHTYNVPTGNAEALVKALVELPDYRPTNTFKMSAISATQIMVWASPEDQMRVAQQLQVPKAPAAVTETIPLAVLDALKVAETLKAMFADKGAAYIEGEPTRNVVIVRGSPEQVREVKLVVQAIGENPAAAGSLRIITLEKGSAATLADALQRLMPQMRDNPIKVILPGSDNTYMPQVAPTPTPGLQKPLVPETPAPIPSVPSKRLSQVSFQDPQLVDPAEKVVKDTKGAGKPITITAFGNKLIVMSDDPQALALVQELVRLMTKTEAGEGDFEVIRLKNANANEIARIVDEAFNGPKQGQGGQKQGGGGFNPISALTQGLGGMLSSAIGGSPQQRVDRVRVVADPATNSILVRATPLDMLTIRNILGKALDAGVTDSNAVVKTWMIGPLKHANASDVAGVIQNVYRDNINVNSQQNRGGGMPIFPFGGQQQQQKPDGHTHPLSVGIDQRSNSLIISCAKPLHDDILKLTEALENNAADSKQLIVVKPIKGIDPILVEQAVEAITGQPSLARRMTQGVGGSGFTGGAGAQFGGGFNNNNNNQGIPGFIPIGGGQGGGLGGGIMLNPGGGFGGGLGGPGIGGVVRPGGGFGGAQGGGGGGPRRPASFRGPDFFDSSVMDDRQSQTLFDPADPGPGGLAQASYQEPGKDGKEPGKEPGKDLLKDDAPKKNDAIVAPRLPVQIEVLDSLGGLLIKAQNQADLDATLKLIDFIIETGNIAQMKIELVPLQKADPTSVVNSLNLLLNRINFSPNATTPITGGVRSGSIIAPTQTAPGLGILGGAGGAAGGLTAQTIQNVPANSSVVLIPLPRLSSILVATFKSRFDDIKKEINRLDQDFAPNANAVPIKLKQQSAARVANLINSFYATRFPQEQQGQNQVRVTFDENSNTIFVQAAPADLAEIRSIVERIDTWVSDAKLDMRIYTVKQAIADDLATIIGRALSEGLATTNPNAGGLPGVGGAGGIFGGLGGGGLGGAGALGGGAGGGLGAGVGGANANITNSATRATKVSSLRLLTNKKFDGRAIEAGILDDIRITSDPRTNNLIIVAPEKTMELIMALVRELDVVPSARAEVNVFQLRKADAYQLALTLQQLFQGTGATRATGGTVGGGIGGAGVGGGLGGGLGGGALGAAGAGIGGAAGQRPALMLTLSGIGPDGAPLIDLRVTIDERTNSLIAAGSRSDLAIIEALIARLEDADIQFRRNEAFRLRNAQAADVAASISDFVTKTLTVLRTGNQLTPFQEIQRDVVVVAEPISNTLLISATPQYMADILRIISELDMMPPQVAVDVLIAEVDMTDANEFGVELGFQSPVLFRRGLSTDGTTATPGFAFNSTAALGNNPQQNAETVGFQGLTNYGVGRSSARQNVGGFVFSASSNTVSVLVRALQVQGRLDILSRPQLMTLDNQTAIINIGQDVPVLSSSNVTATGIVTTNIDRKTIGVIMQVTPRVTPEGRVLMRVIPEVSSIANQNFPLGNGTTSTSFNLQHLETTVSAYDGETVVLGGLISMRDEKNETKAPWLGDLPYLGSMFRYRTQYKTKTELLIIMTPHVVRNKADGERILADEARKMDWNLSNVLKVQGPRSLDFPQGSQGNLAPMPIGPPMLAPPPLEVGPAPRVMPSIPPQPKQVAPMPPPQSQNLVPPSQGPALVPQPLPSGPDANAAPAFPTQVPPGVPVQRLTPTSAIIPQEQTPPPRRSVVGMLLPNFNRGTSVTQTIPNTTPATEGTR